MQLPNNLVEFQLDYAVIPADQKLYNKIIKKLKSYFIIVVDLQVLANLKITEKNARTCIFVRPHNAIQITDTYKQVIQYFSSTGLRYVEISEHILDHILKQCEHNTEANINNSQQQQKLQYQKIQQLPQMTGYANNSSYQFGFGNSIQIIQNTCKPINLQEKRIADFVVGYNDFDRNFQPSYLEKLVSENTLVGEYIVPVTMYNGKQVSNAYAPIQMLPPACDDPTKEHFYCNDCRPWKYYQENLPNICLPLLIINAGNDLRPTGDIIVSSKQLVDTCKEISINYYQKERNIEMAVASYAAYVVPRIQQCNAICKQINEIILNIKNSAQTNGMTSLSKSVKGVGIKSINDKKSNGNEQTTNENINITKSENGTKGILGENIYQYQQDNYQLKILTLNLSLLEQSNAETINQYVYNVIHNICQYLQVLQSNQQLSLNQQLYVKVLLKNVQQEKVKQIILDIITDLLRGIVKQVADPVIVYDFDEYEKILQEQLSMHVYCYVIAGKFLENKDKQTDINVQKILNRFQNTNVSYFDGIYCEFVSQQVHQNQAEQDNTHSKYQNNYIKQKEKSLQTEAILQESQNVQQSNSIQNNLEYDLQSSKQNIINDSFIDAAIKAYQDEIIIFSPNFDKINTLKNYKNITQLSKPLHDQEESIISPNLNSQSSNEQFSLVIGKNQKTHTVYNVIQLMEQFIEVTKVLIERKSIIRLINKTSDMSYRDLEALDEISETTICNNHYIIKWEIMQENSIQSQGIRMDTSEFKRGINSIGKIQVIEEDKAYGKCAVCNQPYNNYQQHCNGILHIEVLKNQMMSAGIYQGLKDVSKHLKYKADVHVQLIRLCDTVSSNLGIAYEDTVKTFNKILTNMGASILLDPSDQPRPNSPRCRQRNFRKWREDIIANCAQQFEDKLAEYKKLQTTEQNPKNQKNNEESKYCDEICNTIALSQYQITQLEQENILRAVLLQVLKENNIQVALNSKYRKQNNDKIFFQDELDTKVKIYDKNLQEFIAADDIKKKNIYPQLYEQDQYNPKLNDQNAKQAQYNISNEENHVFIQQKIRNMLNLNYSSEMYFNISLVFDFFFRKHQQKIVKSGADKAQHQELSTERKINLQENSTKVYINQLRDEISKLEYKTIVKIPQIKLLLKHITDRQFKYNIFYEKSIQNALLDRFRHVIIPPLYTYCPQKHLNNKEILMLIKEKFKNGCSQTNDQCQQVTELINQLSSNKKELQRILDVAEFYGIYYDEYQDDLILNQTTNKIKRLKRSNSIADIGVNLDSDMISMVLLKQQENEFEESFEQNEIAENETKNNRVFILYNLRLQKQHYTQQLLDRSMTYQSQSQISYEETITMASGPQLGPTKPVQIIKDEGCTFNDIIYGYDITDPIATFKTINPAIIASSLGLLSAVTGTQSYVQPAIQIYNDAITSALTQTGLFNANALGAALLSQVLRNNILFDEQSQQYDHYREYQSDSRTISRVTIPGQLFHIYDDYSD